MIVVDMAKIYQLKVTLEESETPVWRRLLVISTSTFWDLHIFIRDSFDWSDDHLNMFTMTQNRKQ